MNEKVVRNLPSGFVINSAAFALLKPAEQQSVFDIAKLSGKPVSFVASFTELSDKKALRDLALAGQDITLRLEFNKIELTSVELAALSAVRPVFEKLGALKNAYAWLEEGVTRHPVTFSEHTFRRNNYVIKVSAALEIWNKVSRYWGDAVKRAPASWNVQTGNEGWRTVGVSKTRITIGCQSLTRFEVEQIAKHYGWEPNV